MELKGFFVICTELWSTLGALLICILLGDETHGERL